MSRSPRENRYPHGPDRALCLRLAASAGADVRTCYRAIRGEYVAPLALARIQAAAHELGITLPPPSLPSKASSFSPAPRVRA